MESTGQAFPLNRTKGTVVSLFSGCGGSDSGVLNAGFTVLLANDIAPYAKALYESNLPETDYRSESISKIHSFPTADLLIGCYPCQGFSQGGARVSHRGINYLYREFDRALRKINPKAFIVENVSGMRRSDFRHLLTNQIVRFRFAGYRVSHNLLNAVNYGVAQERARIFIVGIRSDFGVTYRFPDATHTENGANRFRTIADELIGMPLWPAGEFIEDGFHWYYMSRNRRRDWSEPSKTIVSHPRHIPLHPTSPKLIRIHTDKWIWSSDDPPRRFSYREAACLQGFKRDLVFPEDGTMRQKYEAIGNAVPPPLFQAVAEALPDIW